MQEVGGVWFESYPRRGVWTVTGVSFPVVAARGYTYPLDVHIGAYHVAKLIGS